MRFTALPRPCSWIFQGPNKGKKGEVRRVGKERHGKEMKEEK